jgi:hypothetical protein
MEDMKKFAHNVEFAAKLRKNDIPVPRKFIEAALDLIARGEAECRVFTSGMPDLKRVYDIAVILQSKEVQKH